MIDDADHRCEKRIMIGYHFSTCGKKAKYFEDGTRYCGTHSPAQIKLRAEKKAAKKQAEQDALERDPKHIARMLKLASEKIAEANEFQAYWLDKYEKLDKGDEND